jgi:hypothetical protein
MLYVIANQGFLTKFLMSSISDNSDTAVIWHPHRRRGAHRSLIKFAEATFFRSTTSSLFFDQHYLKQLQKIGDNDSVLIFGVENIKEISIARRFIKSRKISIFTWNPVLDHNQTAWVRKLHIRGLKKLGKVYTFDPDDAEKYGLTLIHQVYRDVSNHLAEQVAPDIDVYFVGQDKGRFQALMQWEHVMRQAGLATHFHIVRSKNGEYSRQELPKLQPAGLSYDDNIRMIQRSRSLLEIVQKNQSGLTVRSLEAAFFGKKLITDNLSMKGSPLYHPDRVFLLGHDDPRRLKAFIAGPCPRIPREQLRDFDFRYWYRQFA